MSKSDEQIKKGVRKIEEMHLHSFRSVVNSLKKIVSLLPEKCEMSDFSLGEDYSIALKRDALRMVITEIEIIKRYLELLKISVPTSDDLSWLEKIVMLEKIVDDTIAKK